VASFRDAVEGAEFEVFEESSHTAHLEEPDHTSRSSGVFLIGQGGRGIPAGVGEMVGGCLKYRNGPEFRVTGAH